MITIRRARASDWRTYRVLRLRALELAPDAYGSTLADEASRSPLWWRARVASAHTLVAWVGESAVGAAVLIPDPHEKGGREIVAVWVEPEARGQGVARQLVLAQVAVARKKGASAVALWVSDGNDGARRVYEACGFELTGERELVRGDLYESRMRRLTAATPTPTAPD